MIFFGKTFRLTFLVIIFFELLSFLGYLVPWINSIAFWLIGLLFVVLAWKKLEWGVAMLLAELFIGSKGYLFSYNFWGHPCSIRIAFWFLILAVWLIKILQYWQWNKNKKFKDWIFLRFFRGHLAKEFGLLFIVIFCSLIVGLINHNSLGNILNDFNAWLFFGLIFVFYDAITNWEQIKIMMQVFTASLLTMSLKSLALLYFFSHQFFGLPALYRWVRTSGVGEITQMGGDYYRIFFQSHIYIIIGLFLVLIYLLFDQNIFNQNSKAVVKKLSVNPLSGLAILLMATILISLSRSFWVGVVFGLIIVFSWYLTVVSLNYRKKILTFTLLVLALLFLALGLINNIVKFPWPQSKTSILLTDLFADRATELSSEAAVGSRWNLLAPLARQVGKFPTILIGNGFGATVTYFSKDPRVLATNPTGEYTTYAFEWGYLDLWLKLGLIGLAVYLFLLGKIVYFGWQRLKAVEFFNLTEQTKLILGLLIGFLVLSVIHFFTPYLNHPLGIGYILLCVMIFEVETRH